MLHPEWTHKLTGQTLMLPDYEKGPVAIELSEKLAGTKVAIGNPEIARLGGSQERFEQRTILGMAICTRHHIGDQATRRLIHYQGLAGKSCGLHLPQGPEPTLARLKTVAIDDFDPMPGQPGLAFPTDLLDQGGELRGAVTHQL